MDVPHITRIRTEAGEAQIDYQALANLPKLDATLSQEGSFADAKAVGDAIAIANNAINELSNEFTNLTPEDIGAINVDKIANNLTTIEEGYVLDAKQGYELHLLIQQRAKTSSYTATFSKDSWTASEENSTMYTQTVAVDGILSTDDPIVDIDMSGATTSDEWAALTEMWCLVGRITTGDGNVTMYCYENAPTKDIKIYLKVVR